MVIFQKETASQELYKYHFLWYILLIMFERFSRGKAEYTTSPLVEFNVVKLIEVDPAVEDATKAAINAVWHRHMDTTTSVNITFANTVALPMPDGSEKLIDAVYEDSTNTILIAVGSFAEKYPDWTPEQMSVIVAGHEIRHKIQNEIGDPAQPSNELMASGTYYDSRHEVEGHMSSVEAFNDVYPGEPISFAADSEGSYHVYANFQASDVTIYVQ
jgi:hypothetical protein